jgi:hypothetical protein
VTTTFLIGGRAYPVDEKGTRWLVEHLRQWFVVNPMPVEAEPADIERAQLLIEAILEDDPEPLELGLPDVNVLCIALGDHLVAGNVGLEALFNGAQRLQGQPEAPFRPHPDDPSSPSA